MEDVELLMVIGVGVGVGGGGGDDAGSVMIVVGAADGSGCDGG